MGNMQEIVFWQNIISPHQIDFLKELSNYYQTTLIVDRKIDSYRKNDGWKTPDTEIINIYENPKEDILKSFFKKKNSIHVFSGIGAYKVVNKGFQIAIRNNARIGIISEPINFRGLKGKMKLIKGNWLRFMYNRKIDFIATTGDLGIKTYTKFGYDSYKLHQWGYFIEYSNNLEIKKENSIIYVGQLIDRKQIYYLTKLLIENDLFKFDKFYILGKGSLANPIKDLINKSGLSSKIELKGRLSEKETKEYISKSKLMVIPSKFDGWAVVVNEALLLSFAPAIAF